MDEAGDDPDKPPQGWFRDPFGVHESRWFSQGTPTALVRDGRVEAQDPPPEPVWTGPLAPAAVAASPGRPPVGRPAPDDDGGAPEEGSQFGFLGDPALPGTEPAPLTAGPSLRPSGMFTFRTDRPQPTPKRIVAYRWVALGLAVGWSLLLTALVLADTTTGGSGAGAHATGPLTSSDPAAVALFAVFLLTCCGVAGFGLLGRVRSGSEAAGRSGYVVAGILFVLGVLSLASIGLSLVILAFALWVVARPVRRPRPVPGERVD
jgi:hypothetical protein